jgi:hypothetical protein
MSIPFNVLEPVQPTVSTLTVLYPYTELSALYPTIDFDSILMAVINLDETNPVDVTFWTSEDGVHPDGSFTYSYTIDPQTQQSLEIDNLTPRAFFSISASSQGPGYPPVIVQAYVRGIVHKYKPI